MNIYHINWWLPAFLPSTACQKKNGAHGADHRSKVITFQWVKGAAVRMAAVLVMSPPSYTFQRWLSWKFMVPKRPRLCGTAFSTRIQRRHPVTGNMAPWQQPGSKTSLNSYGKPRRWGPYWCGQDRYWNYFDMFLAGTEGGDNTFVKFWNVGSSCFKFVLQLVHVQYNGWIVVLSFVVLNIWNIDIYILYWKMSIAMDVRLPESITYLCVFLVWCLVYCVLILYLTGVCIPIHLSWINTLYLYNYIYYIMGFGTNVS